MNTVHAAIMKTVFLLSPGHSHRDHATVTFSHRHRNPCRCHFQSWTQKSMPLSLKVMDTEVHANVTENNGHRNPCHCHFQSLTQKFMPLSLKIVDTEIHAIVTFSHRRRNTCHCH